MREKSFNITPKVYLSKVDSKWPSKTTKKNAFFLSFARLKRNSKGMLGNETPIASRYLDLVDCKN